MIFLFSSFAMPLCQVNLVLVPLFLAGCSAWSQEPCYFKSLMPPYLMFDCKVNMISLKMSLVRLLYWTNHSLTLRTELNRIIANCFAEEGLQVCHKNVHNSGGMGHYIITHERVTLSHWKLNRLQKDHCNLTVTVILLRVYFYLSSNHHMFSGPWAAPRLFH